MTTDPLTNLEHAVVELIAEGYTRWKIADELGVGESRVRATIRDLCERFDCPMRDLPFKAVPE